MLHKDEMNYWGNNNVVFGHFEEKLGSAVYLLYAASIRLLLKYRVQFWCPHFEKDAKPLERIERWTAKPIQSWTASLAR